MNTQEMLLRSAFLGEDGPSNIGKWSWMGDVKLIQPYADAVIEAFGEPISNPMKEMLVDAATQGIDHFKMNPPSYSDGLLALAAYPTDIELIQYVLFVLEHYIRVGGMTAEELKDFQDSLVESEEEQFRDNTFVTTDGLSAEGDSADSKGASPILFKKDWDNWVNHLKSGIAELDIRARALAKLVPDLVAPPNTEQMFKEFGGEEIDYFQAETLLESLRSKQGLTDVGISTSLFAERHEEEHYNSMSSADMETGPESVLVLLDFSASMHAGHRNVRAAAVFYERLMRVMAGKTVVAIMTFAGEATLKELPDGSTILDTKDKAQYALNNWVSDYIQCRGNCTNLTEAVRQAAKEVRRMAGEYKSQEMEIILVTDDAYMDSNVDVGGAKFNCLAATDNEAARRLCQRTGGTYVDLGKVPLDVRY